MFKNVETHCFPQKGARVHCGARGASVQFGNQGSVPFPFSSGSMDVLFPGAHITPCPPQLLGTGHEVLWPLLLDKAQETVHMRFPLKPFVPSLSAKRTFSLSFDFSHIKAHNWLQLCCDVPFPLPVSGAGLV